MKITFISPRLCVGELDYKNLVESISAPLPLLVVHSGKKFSEFASEILRSKWFEILLLVRFILINVDNWKNYGNDKTLFCHVFLWESKWFNGWILLKGVIVITLVWFCREPFDFPAGLVGCCNGIKSDLEIRVVVGDTKFLRFNCDLHEMLRITKALTYERLPNADLCVIWIWVGAMKTSHYEFSGSPFCLHKRW